MKQQRCRWFRMTKAKAENQLANTPTGSGGVVAIMGRVKFLNDEFTTVAAHRLCYRNTTTVSDGVGGTTFVLWTSCQMVDRRHSVPISLMVHILLLVSWYHSSPSYTSNNMCVYVLM